MTSGVHRPQAEGSQTSACLCPQPREFPTGLSCVPFIWQYLRDEIAMELLGGFVGISQDRTTLGLRPAIGWAVREAH